MPALMAARERLRTVRNDRNGARLHEIMGRYAPDTARYAGSAKMHWEVFAALAAVSLSALAAVSLSTLAVVSTSPPSGRFTISPPNGRFTTSPPGGRWLIGKGKARLPSRIYIQWEGSRTSKVHTTKLAHLPLGVDPLLADPTACGFGRAHRLGNLNSYRTRLGPVSDSQTGLPEYRYPE